MLAVGTQVMYGDDPATIIKVDKNDLGLPYLVMKDDGLDDWVRSDEITVTHPYQVTEEAINAVEVKDHSDGDYNTSLYKINPNNRTPKSLRDTAAQHILTATHYEALARHMESQVDPDEDAKAIYYEAYPKNKGYLSWDMSTAERREMARKLAEARK